MVNPRWKYRQFCLWIHSLPKHYATYPPGMRHESLTPPVYTSGPPYPLLPLPLVLVQQVISADQKSPQWVFSSLPSPPVGMQQTGCLHYSLLRLQWSALCLQVPVTFPFRSWVYHSISSLTPLLLVSRGCLIPHGFFIPCPHPCQKLSC